MPESLDSVFLFAVLAVVGLGLLWLSRSARGREIMSLVNVPTVSGAEQLVIAKEQAAERAEFELAIAEDLFESASTLNALSTTARSLRAEATIARTNFEHGEQTATEPVQQPQPVPQRSRLGWILRPGMTTAVRDRNNHKR